MRHLDKAFFILLLALSLVFIGCGSDDDDADTNTNTSSSGTDASSSSGMTDASSSSGMTDASSSSGMTDASSSSSGMEDVPPVDMPPSRLEANGCTFDTATDMTGMAEVSVTDVSAWSVPHSACIIVSAGTIVSWTGNFDFHPLGGGVTGMPDDASPITLAGPGAGDATLSVTLDDAVDRPYYCTIHNGTMQGVIYVNP